MSDEHDIAVDGGRTLRVHDTGAAGRGRMTLLWQTGSPQTGELLEPVIRATADRGIRLISYGRPGYGGSTRQIGRRVDGAAADVRAIVDALGVDRFAAMGASGGGPHVLAAAALLPERVVGAVTLAGIAPFSTDFDWFDGMRAPGGLSAAREGYEARERFAETDEFDSESFVDADWRTLAGEWAALGDDSQKAEQAGSAGLVDDDLAFATDWGFDVRQIERPVLVAQGGRDRVVPAAHGHWLLGACGTELWLRPNDGHISILRAVPLALDWLLAL